MHTFGLNFFVRLMCTNSHIGVSMMMRIRIHQTLKLTILLERQGGVGLALKIQDGIVYVDALQPKGAAEVSG
jgi:hypothetical protein